MIGAVTFHTLIAYPLIFNPIFVAVEYTLKTHKYRYRIVAFATRVVVRTLLVALTTSIAVITDFDDFLVLIGAIGSSFTVFILPVCFYLKLSLERVTWYEVVICVLIGLIAISSCFIGSWEAIKSIISLISSNTFHW